MSNDLPNVAKAIAGALALVAEPDRPLLIAILERMAAERYRAWADDPANATHSNALRACAAREDDIASRVEGLYPDADTRARALLAAHPDLSETNRTFFAGRPFAQQFAMQAGGERLGAATWRSFATNETDPRRRDVFWSCAPLEETSAEVLEGILGRT
jgi:hypothetical protein